jgi:PAS domain S-box-containing protein
MSQTTSTSALTKFWNMSAPLHPLLIENSASEAEKNVYELQRAGFQCKPQIISSRQELLDHVARFPYDVVLSNYRLRGWTGIDAFGAVRSAGREVPFILVTETLGEEEAVECIKQGVTDYVLKENLARLPVVVARALEEKALRDARQLMIQALRQSEGNSLFLFAQNPLPMWVFDIATLQVLQVNDAAIRHYGFSRDEFLQLRMGDLHPAEEVPRLMAEIRHTKSHEKLSCEWIHRKKDGSPINVEMYLQKMD